MERVSLETPYEGVALITLTDPEINNHLCWAGIDELGENLVRARENGARVVVLASGVPDHWYQHAWLKDLRNSIKGEPTTGIGAGWFTTLHELTATHVVSIAAISGDCSGGGAELGWACDLRVAEEQAEFSQPEVILGLTTGIGGTSRLMRLIGRCATAEMVLDGAPMSAQRIYELGGINRIVPKGSAIETSLQWAKRLASRPATSLAGLKKILVNAENHHLNDALAQEQELFQQIVRTPEADQRMKQTQDRFDAGASIREVYSSEI